MRRRCFIIILCLLCLGIYAWAQQAGWGKIANDSFWMDADGMPIYSQGGGIFRFPDPNTGKMRYYWYGVRYHEAEEYLVNPTVTQEQARFRSVTCYSSDDLVKWTFEGDVLDAAELCRGGSDAEGWTGRMGVAYIKDIDRYALFVQHASEKASNGESVLVALSESPKGKFVWHNWFSMRDMIGTPNTGDQTVFTDEDTGRSYLVYSYGRGRNKIYLSEIGYRDGKVGLLDCHQIFRGEGREGNCMFKYKGKYYMCASDLYGWDSSHAYYLVADSICGPYLPENKMEVMDGCSADYAHVSQTGFFVTVRGSRQETVIFCGDRWADFAGNGLGYNQWVPLSFDGERPYFNSLGSWYLNHETGEWRVAEDNNYVVNGSFEADRRSVPNPVKPRQDWLSGWTTTVVSGNQVSFDSISSPRLNYFNTQEDRRYVVGEKSLRISDKVPFERRVSQVLQSTPYVALPDGLYTMKVKIRCNSRFSSLDMYAHSGGRTFSRSMKDVPTDKWYMITLENIVIKDGCVEIGFHALGEAHAECLLDDVELRCSFVL